MNRIISRLLIFIFLFSGVCVAEASSVKLSVSAMRGQREIYVGDIFYISFEVSDLEKGLVSPSSVPGAKVLYFERTGQSSRFSSVNGKVTQSYSYTYTLSLRAEKEGSYSFGPVEVEGVKSNVVKYTIYPKDASPQNQANRNNPSNAVVTPDDNKPKYIGKGDGNLFLKAEVSKSSAYPQEALVYTVKLYTTYDAIKFIGATAAPKFDGFVVEESSDISTSLEYETYNNQTYATAVIARYIIFPQIEGQLKVKGNTYTVSVDAREYYHDPFFGNMSVSKPLQLNVTPNELTVNVKELPKPVPTDFCGGVGQFTFTSSLPDQSYKSNNAASIVYEVKGTGNLKYVTLPDLNNLYPPQLEVYSPTPDIKTVVGKNNVSGSVTFDYSFMPLETGTYRIPEIKLTYFNPASGKYESTTAKGYVINVEEGKGSDKSQKLSKLAFDPELKKVKTNLSQEVVPVIGTFGYWLFFYIIPAVLFILIVIIYRKYIEANSDIVAVRSRKASKVARKRLRRAETCMEKGETEKFYDVMLESMWGYLGDRLKIPVSGLNRANIREEFSKLGIPEDLAVKMIEIVDDCEFYKYSSAGASSEMKDVYEKGVDVIDSLEESLKNRGKESKTN